jgi:flagellar hook-length control protein FliK
MAIALDSDFRSLKTGPMPDLGERASSRSGNGEAFASQLRLNHPSVALEPGKTATETTSLTYGGQIMPADPAETADAAPTEGALQARAQTPPEDIEQRLISEDIASPDSTNRSDEPVIAKLTPADPVLTADTEDLDVGEPALIEDNPESETEKAELIAAQMPPTTAVPVPVASTSTQPAPAAAVEASEAPQPDVSAAATSGEVIAVAAAMAPSDGKLSETTERPTQMAIPAGQAIKPEALRRTQGDQADPAAALPQAAATEISGLDLARAPDQPAPADTTAPTSTTSPSGLGAVNSAAAPSLAPTPATLPMTPVQAVITASPAQIVDIVTQSAEDGQSDRIVVQLDPPELGRVSIDFKFDAAGLQHVTITGETPEAMRQLRLMHFELVQSLERQGLNSQNMTFQHQQQNTQNGPGLGAGGRAALPAADTDLLVASTVTPTGHNSTPRTLSGGRLDIRL